jgi:class 3 adenylate cyclase
MVVKGSTNNNNVSTVFLCVFSAVLGYAIAEFRRKKQERIMADDEDVGYDNKRSTESERPAPLVSSTQTDFVTNIIDGEKRMENQEGETASLGTNVTILPKEGYLPDDSEIVQQAHDFDVQVISKVKTLQDSKLLLRRTRAVNALASQLMAAPDEESCYQVASRLMVPLFGVDRCAYALLKDADHFIVKNVAVQNRKHAAALGMEAKTQGGSVVKPLKDTMIGLCAETLTQQYCPRTKDSQFEFQRKIYHKMGISSVLATPILVNQNRFAGAIVISMEEEDAFKFHDRILMSDIASMLGANIYAKRMRRAAERSNKISREILHAMIPPPVIEKIEVFWDENSDEYRSRRSSMDMRESDSLASSTDHTMTWDDSYHQRPQSISKSDSVNNFLNQMRTMNDDDETGIVVDTSAMDMISASSSFNRALYAENVKDVCIIFTDIVGFSRMAMTSRPVDVMDLVQSLFSRFDLLCKKHGVMKLETIGDAYLCTTNLFDDHTSAKDAAHSALNMAIDMIYATQDVSVLAKERGRKSLWLESLQIRVGIHIGEVVAGVLGETLPKFTLFGHNVNTAARMEQAGKPNKIRVSEAFHSLVSDVDGWGEYEMVQMKNMGETGTYLLDPLRLRY